MSGSDTSKIAMLLARVEEGDTDAFNNLYNAVYGELKLIAARQRGQWDGDFTLNTTALVHEAYEKLVRTPNRTWGNQRHFYSVAAKAMRRILYTYAESKGAKKRGGGMPKISLDERLSEDVFTFSEARALEIMAVEEALQQLEEISPREARIVEYRFYLGMNVEETAKMLDISTPTVKRGWAMARGWLYDRLEN